VQERLDKNPQAMRVRRETVEHPFATLKMRMLDALSDEAAEERCHRNGVECTRLQSDARDRDYGCRRTTGGHGRVSRELHVEICPHGELFIGSRPHKGG
jgi:hypothetical protein